MTFFIIIGWFVFKAYTWTTCMILIFLHIFFSK